MDKQDLFEAFFSVIEHGNGKKIADFFNEQLNMAKQNEEDLKFLIQSLQLYRQNDMVYEHKEIFKTFIELARKELEKI